LTDEVDGDGAHGERRPAAVQRPQRRTGQRDRRPHVRVGQHRGGPQC